MPNRDILTPAKEPATVAEQFRGRGTGAEFLLTVYSDGTREVAWRADQWSTWSPPVVLTAVPSAGVAS